MSVTQLPRRIEKAQDRAPDTAPQTPKQQRAVRVRQYSPEFRAQAVALVKEQKFSISAAARKLDIAYDTLRSWIYIHDAAHARASVTAERKERASERRQHMCEAIALLKQAVELMHAACNPATKQEKPA